MKSVVTLALLALIALAGLTLWYRGGDRSVDSPISAPSTASNSYAESQLVVPTQVFKSSLPVGPPAPDIVSNTWLNAAPLAPADLSGKVVLIEFWTSG